MARKLLIDTMPFKVLFEESDSKGRLVARGEHARFSEATANGRLYPKSVWEVNKNRLSDAMERRRMFGELDHPGDGKTKLQRVSHITTSFEIDDGAGVVTAVDEILDTPNGRILKALSEAGCEIGVSSRGFGSVKTDEQGREVVQDDYQLMGWDFVADPAMRTAYPQIFAEENKIPEGDMDVKTLKKEYPDIYKTIAEEAKDEVLKESNQQLSEVKETSQKTIKEAVEKAEKRVEEELTDKFTEKLLGEMESVRDETEKKVKADLMSDPDVAGAKLALAAVAETLTPYIIPQNVEEAVKVKNEEIESLKRDLAEKELEVGQLKSENGELAAVAKKAAYTLHLERLVSEDEVEARTAIIELVGKVEEFDATEEIDAKVDAIRAELDRRSSDNTSEEDSREEIEARDAQIEELKRQNVELKEKVLAVAELAEQMSVQAHVSNRLVGNPHAKNRSLRRKLETAKTIKEADEILDIFGEESHDQEEMDRIQSRVRRGKSHDISEDTNGSQKGMKPKTRQGVDPLADLGLNIEEVADNCGLNYIKEEEGSVRH